MPTKILAGSRPYFRKHSREEANRICLSILLREQDRRIEDGRAIPWLGEIPASARAEDHSELMKAFHFSYLLDRMHERYTGFEMFRQVIEVNVPESQMICEIEETHPVLVSIRSSRHKMEGMDRIKFAIESLCKQHYLDVDVYQTPPHGVIAVSRRFDTLKMGYELSNTRVSELVHLVCPEWRRALLESYLGPDGVRVGYLGTKLTVPVNRA